MPIAPVATRPVISVTNDQPSVAPTTTPAPQAIAADRFERLVKNVRIAEGRIALPLSEPVLMRESAPFQGFDAVFTLPLNQDLATALRGRTISKIELDEPWRESTAKPVTFKVSGDVVEVTAPDTSQAKGLWTKVPPMLAVTLSDGAQVFIDTKPKALRFDFEASERSHLESNLKFHRDMLSFHQGRLAWAKERVARPDDESLFDPPMRDALDYLHASFNRSEAQAYFDSKKADYLDRCRGLVSYSQREIDNTRVEIAKLEKTLSGPVKRFETIELAPQ